MIHFIIVNYNSSVDLEQCVDSLPVEGCQIHVIDNASSLEGEDARCLYLAGARENLNVTLSRTNLGFAGAVNTVARSIPRSPGDILWILNPDARLIGDAMNQMAKSVHRERGAVFSPVITTGPPGAERVWYGGGTIDSAHARVRHSARRPIEELTKSSFITGAAMAMESSTWDQIGGFRTDLFMYWEDADLSARAQQRGIPLFTVRDSEVWHRVGGSSGEHAKSPLWYYFLCRNRLIVCANSRRHALHLTLFSGGELPRMIVRALRESGSARLRWRAMFLGTVDGIRSVAANRTVGGLERLSSSPRNP